MINRFIGIGRWCKENEMRYSKEGTAILNNTIAINDRFNKDNTTFLQVVAFKKTAENTANFTTKGSQVAIEGRIQTRNYINKNDQKVYVTEIIADSITFLDPKGDKPNASQQSNSKPDKWTPDDVPDSELPF
jgi:single-strand DNA-binding protein